VVGGLGSAHEGRVAVVHFTRNRLHLGAVEHIGAEHDASRIARERAAREGIDLEDLDAA
jgi:hypothetical protein